MVYGYNNKVGIPNLANSNLSESGKINTEIANSINIKSQKQVGNNSVNGTAANANKESLINIKKEKERIHHLLNQNSVNLQKIVVPSSRNSKEDQ